MLKFFKPKYSAEFRCQIVFISLLAACIFSGCTTQNGTAELDDNRAFQRQPKAGRTLVVSRGQMKYGLERNYLRRWVDRPLFQNTSLRAEAGHPQPYGSYRRMAEIARSYDLDGFAFLPETSGRMNIFEYTARGVPEGFQLLPEFITTNNREAKQLVLEAALRTPQTLRIDGRIPITGYRTDSLALDEWSTLLGEFRKSYGDQFIFMPDVGRPAGLGWLGWVEKYRLGTLTEQDLQKIEEYLHDVLEVFDGLYFAGAAGLKWKHKFDTDFYREIFVPLYQKVLSEPQHKDKYFGLSACIGHMNCTRLGYTLTEDGTKTLRHSFETAMNARPDLIVLPEWDEENENTSIRPTVYNGLSTQRILRYYMQKIKNEPLTPKEGDNTAIPNLIVSWRKLLTLGEELEIELLHVPDGSTRTSYNCEVSLLDENGKEVYQFDKAVFSGQTMQEVTLKIPSEKLAEYNVLVPELKLEYGHSKLNFREGLHHIQLRPTWNWDYKWVKTGLRDLYEPDAAAFDMESVTGEQFRVKGHIHGSEKLASVEVLDNDAVVYAVSAEGDDMRDLKDHVTLSLEFRHFDRNEMHGKVTVQNASVKWSETQWGFHRTYRIDENAVHLNSRLDWAPRIIFASIPREQADEAFIEVDMNLFKERIAVRDVLKKKIVSFSEDRGKTLTVAEFKRQADHPLHLNREQAAFDVKVTPDSPDSVFHMRAITESGKIYRSRPWTVGVSADAETGLVKLPVFSDTLQQPVQVAVEKSRVPDIRYKFDPGSSALVTRAGRVFWAHLGGYTDSVTGRGGDGGLDGSPFVRRSNYPENAEQMAPVWVEKDGQACLEFDGTGTFIAFPQGVLPRRAPFTVEFDVFPLEDKTQTLFTHHGNYIGSLTVRWEDGRLQGLFVNDHADKYAFDSGLELPLNEWSHVEVSYDLENIRARVNDLESEPFPCQRPGLYDVTSVFGGFGQGDKTPSEFVGNTGWFKGYLRSLRIQHMIYRGADHEER